MRMWPNLPWKSFYSIKLQLSGYYYVVFLLLCLEVPPRISSQSVTQGCGFEDTNITFSAESRLINCLLDRYAQVSTLSRPVQDSSTSVAIQFGISLIQILDFDEIKQILTTSMWKNYVWEDQVLRWDPQAYDGVTHIRLPATALWVPDIVLYNNADEQVKQHEELVAVYFNGTVKWIPPAIYRSSCEIDMQNFPFDRQTCSFKFGSWTYDEYKVDLRLYDERMDIDLQEYVSSSEWDIINSSAVRHIRRYPFFDADPYPELIFTLSIKRQSTFYIYLLVLPCVLLSSLTLVLFWIPPQRPDRTAVGMSLFSSFFILLLILVQSSPPTSASISRLGIHYCVNMVMIAVSTILSVMIINMGQSSYRMTSRSNTPKWLQSPILDGLAKMLCLKTPPPVEHMEKMSENGMYMESLTEQGKLKRSKSFKQAIADPKTTARWRVFAAVLDRIFFIIYLIILVMSTVFIFPR